MTAIARAVKAFDFIPINAGGETISTFEASIAPFGVTPATALGLSAVWRAVWVLSSTLAQLPLHVYTRLEPFGKERDPSHPLYPLLHDRVNPRMTSYQWRLTMMAHVVTWGNGYSEIVRDGLGRVVELWPLRPDRMRVTLESTADGRGRVVYHYRGSNGVESIVDSSRIFHVRGLGYDGLIGYSVITIARRSLGLTQSAEQFGTRLFQSNARPGLIVTHPQTLNNPARENLGKSLRENHEGIANAGKTLLLEEGMTATTIGFPADDAQFLQTREFQTTEVARWFGVQPHRLFDLTHATFSNIEHLGIEWVQDFGGWLVNWEQEFAVQLFAPRDPAFAEFNVDGLLRGDTAARMTAYREMFNTGSIASDEIRGKENMNPRDDGLGMIFYRALNMVPATATNDAGMTRDQAIDAVGALIRAGFQPADALVALGLEPIAHTGLESVTLSDQGDFVKSTNGTGEH